MPAAAERPAGPAGQTGKALLPCVRKPADLDRLTSEQLVTLASEIRQHLVASVARTGGPVSYTHLTLPTNREV